MRVLVGPRTDLGRDQVVAATAAALAGPGGSVASLRDAGVRNLSRPLSQAEVALLREALRGGRPASRTREDEQGSAGERTVVGYVCRGARVGADTGGPGGFARLIAVADHADLTWRSPLAGPNDDLAGPRFPGMTGIYSPETVLDRLGASEGMIVMPGVVAGVRDDGRPTAYEAEIAAAQGHAAVSSELVPVVVVAAHLGLRVAAVLVEGS